MPCQIAFKLDAAGYLSMAVFVTKILCNLVFRSWLCMANSFVITRHTKFYSTQFKYDALKSKLIDICLRL